MEEKKEAVGLKVNVQNIGEEPVEEIQEEVTENVEEETTIDEDPQEEEITEDPAEEVEGDVVDNTGTLGDIFPPVIDATVEKEEVEEEKDEYKLIACGRLFGETGTTLYRFDIFFKKFEENSGIFEFRNVVDNFEAARPNSVKEYKEFFAVIGIIRWNFHNKFMAVNQNPYSSITTVESAINEHLKIAGIKKEKFYFRIDTVCKTDRG